MFTDLKTKTLLVTGASGFIGSRLVHRLAAISDCHVLALSRNKQTSIANVRWLQSDLQSITKNFWQQHNIKKIDIVFHLGAYTPKSVNDANNIESIYRDNLLGTQHLYASLPNQPERIIFASTLDVYAPANDVTISEQSQLGPTGLYGSSKLFCEQLTQVYAQQYDSAHAILRYGHIYGPGEMLYRKFIPITIQKLLSGEAPVIFGDGSTLRDFLYVDDAVEASLRAAVHADKKLGPINIVSGIPVSLREVIEILVKFSNQNLLPQYRNEQSNGLSLQFDNACMWEKLGKWALTPLVDGLRAEYEYQKSYAL